MVRRVLLSLAIHTDDTTVPVWDPTLPHTRTGQFWVHVGDARHSYVVYDYTPRQTRDGPGAFLKAFRGYLQADAFIGYDRTSASAPVPAHAALARIRQLYQIEHDAAELSADNRRALREKDALPLLNAFEE
jgi:transposase